MPSEDANYWAEAALARFPGLRFKLIRQESREKKPAAKTKLDRINKKAEIIATMKRPKGSTLAEAAAHRAGLR
jgi:hypothetical protein